MIQALPLVYAPNEIFKKKASTVEIIDDDIKNIIDRMIATLYVEGAVGLGANMVGILKRIVVIDLQEDNIRTPEVFVNPVIVYKSEETQMFNESSVCFRGIAADITRPKNIKVSYLDYQGEVREIEAEGFKACVLQHEIDYLEGKTFLDHLSKLKADMLLKKMLKYIKLNPPHVHNAGCRH